MPLSPDNIMSSQNYNIKSRFEAEQIDYDNNQKLFFFMLRVESLFLFINLVVNRVGPYLYKFLNSFKEKPKIPTLKNNHKSSWNHY